MTNLSKLQTKKASIYKSSCPVQLVIKQLNIGCNINIMNLFLLIFFISLTEFGNFVPEKRKSVGVPDTNEALAKHEMEHYDDFFKKMRIYEKWPEVDHNNTVNFCKHFLSKLCSRKYTHLKSATFKFIHLQYVRMKVHNQKVLKITSICCEPTPLIFNRRFFHFVRAPDSRCAFLLHNMSKNSKTFVIALQICEYHTYKQLRNDLIGIYKTTSYTLTRDSDKPTQIVYYEREHLQAFLFHTELYQVWPELKNDISMNVYCRVILKKMFPKTQFDCNPSLKSIPLHYNSFEYGKDLYVSALFCNPSKEAFHNSQQFIRAPNIGPNFCVYLIRNVSGGRANKPCYKMAKKVCADEKDDLSQISTELYEVVENTIEKAQQTHSHDFVEEIRNEMRRESDESQESVFGDLGSIISEHLLDLPPDESE